MLVRVLPLLLAACGGRLIDLPDTDDDTVDTDVVDTQVVDTEIDDTDVADTDTDEPLDTDVACETPSPLDVEVPDARAVVAGDAAVDGLASDVVALAARLHRAAVAEGAVNTWVSPTNLATFLVLLDLDATGDAVVNLDDVLAPSGPLADRSATLAAWLDDLDAPPAQRHAVIQHVAALFHRADSGPGTDWTIAAAPFGVDVRPLDLADPEAARGRVNAWVLHHTACLIDELFPEGTFDASTRSVLVDATAVVADWPEPFSPDATENRPFHLADGATVGVPTLAGPVLDAGLGLVDGVHVLRLPLADPTLALHLAWTDAHDGLAAVEADLDGDKLAALLAGTTPTAVDLTLPKLALVHHPDAAALLTRAGLGPAIAPAADRGDLCVGCPLAAIEHEAALVVDEQGIRAAAATGGTLTDSGGPVLTPVAVDRPFLIVLRDEAAGVPLFVGRVGDPRAP